MATHLNGLSWPIALAQARGLGHRLGPTRDWGVMKHAVCQKCHAYAVERTDDGLGVTGTALMDKCDGRPWP